MAFCETRQSKSSRCSEGVLLTRSRRFARSDDQSGTCRRRDGSHGSGVSSSRSLATFEARKEPNFVACCDFCGRPPMWLLDRVRCGSEQQERIFQSKLAGMMTATCCHDRCPDDLDEVPGIEKNMLSLEKAAKVRHFVHSADGTHLTNFVKHASKMYDWASCLGSQLLDEMPIHISQLVFFLVRAPVLNRQMVRNSLGANQMCPR